MEPDLGWTFEQYRTYERLRAAQCEEEQHEASATGLVTDPKTAPHGGYRVGCTWPREVTAPASELSSRLAALLPGTPAYPYDSLQSSIGNLRPAEDRLIDPDGIAEDRLVLDKLCEAVEKALKETATDRQRCETAFDRGYLARRMAYVFGRPEAGYWQLQQAVHAESSHVGVELVNGWGPHLTLTRFGQTAGPDMAVKTIELLAAWQPVSVAPEAIVVGFYTVGDGSFSVTAHESFPVG